MDDIKPDSPAMVGPDGTTLSQAPYSFQEFELLRVDSYRASFVPGNMCFKFSDFHERSYELDLKQELSRERAHWGSVLDPSAVALMNRTNDLLRIPEVLNRAVTKGDRAPNFRLPNVQGGTVELDALLRTGPVVLNFYRGQWCPYCNLELRSYQKRLSEINDLGASLVAISSQTPDNSLGTAEKNELSYPVLSDVGLNVSRAYGLAFDLPADLVDLYQRQWSNDLVKWNGDGGWSLPIPATYVIGCDGRVALAYVDPDYRDRLDPNDVIAVLKKLSVQN